MSDSDIMERHNISLDFLEFPKQHTWDGENLSPGISLRGLNAASVASMVFNPFEKSCCLFNPWIIWNIPPILQIPPIYPANLSLLFPSQQCRV